jgi:putative FmdB family regulatory protein
VPIYEYRCKGCDREFEKYVPSTTTTVACPACESAQVMRKLSVFGMKTAGTFQPSAMTGGGGCCGGGGCGCH